MPQVTYITPAGETRVVENAEGTLMSAAVANQVEGIDGDCGGVCSCATCHVHVDPAWQEKVGPATAAEEGMLELEDEATEASRLGCQVTLTPELDGLVVRVVGR
ncbi:2Fe-2S iron-sulfur cluster-binding protein [Phycisphaera mikurensis]|uniref:2Fe-2S ferredoxin n=1 Tax=Phycisphaera mikurensis (strain NBRC 102666 / KCTC 22515 / FYK2301M01) TaxID=1142394 RepID=I0IG55_PHYMF|nr:2Fe-2S iron-sulfur cluster-binding protein [Phycisphaera mikurensis]MBB6440374.1 2Fe-2S ferredoxin [Phycisphaera mikurensis]BAM04243.1 2Fe-2S ferredoxin [Phycisphaera mikurensis NBRC 102666]